MNLSFPKFFFLWVAAFVVLLWIALDLSGRLVWILKRSAWEKQGIVFDAARHVREVSPEDDFLEAPIVKRWIAKDGAVLDATNWQAFSPTIATANRSDWIDREGNAERFLEAMAPHEGILAEIREAAARPDVSSPGPEDLLNTGGLPVNTFWYIETITLRARALLRVGREEEAVGELIAGLRVAEHLGKLNAPVSRLIRAGFLSFFEIGFKDGLATRSWDEEQLHALAGAIDRVHLTRGYAGATVASLSYPGMSAESMYPSANRFERFEAAGKALRNLKGSPDPLGRWEDFLENTVTGILPHGFWDWYWSRVCAVGVENLFLENGKLSPELTIEQVRQVSQHSPKSFHGNFYFEWHDSSLDILEARQRYDLIQLAIILERHALEAGNYPEQLDQLVPKWIPGVPNDRYDPSRVIGYERTSDGRYRLLSVGYDGINDGGGTGDLVWDYTVSAPL